MAEKVLNFKVSSQFPFALTGKCYEICHFSYNLPFSVIRKEENKEILTVIIMIMSRHIE